MEKVIYAGNLIGTETGFSCKSMAVSIENKQIVKIQSRDQFSLKKGVQVLDWSNFSILPGLIDCHDHLGYDMEQPMEEVMREPDAMNALRAVRNSRACIEAGITTVRTMGEKNCIDISLKKAIDAGWIKGPRLVNACQSIARTGGNAWFIGVEADGKDGLRRAIRHQAKQGAEVIKIMLTGGGATKEGEPTGPEYSDEEIIAAIDEAHRLNRKIAAHALGGPAARTAIENGIDSIEHGVFLTEEELKLMAEKGIFLVINCGVYARMISQSRSPDAPEYFKRKCAELEVQYPKTIALAKKHGVKVAFGGDTYHADPLSEFEGLIRAGYSHEAALKAGTIHAAELLGMENRIGSIAVGKDADLIAVHGDPLVDIKHIEKIQFVMKAGSILYESHLDNHSNRV